MLQAPFGSFDNDDIIIYKETHNIKFNHDICMCDFKRFNGLDIKFMINRESLL